MRPTAALSVSVLHLVAYFAFLVLGLPDGMLGVAWPSMSEAFARPLGALGILLFGFTLGYLATTAAAGPLIKRIGYRRHLSTAALLMALGGAGIALAPLWAAVIAASALLGAGAGMLDGGLNAYAAQRFRPRDLNWLHAAYGVGATSGPLLMTPIVASAASWRLGYVVFGLCAAAVLVAFRLSRSRWDAPPAPQAAEAGAPAAARDARGGARVVIAGSLLVFFFYTGLEVVAGQWSYSLFTVGRGVDAGRAGPWISAYWGALTVGRVVFGWAAERIRAETLLRGSSLVAILAVAVLWLGRPPVVAAAGLALLGFCLAPMFPLLIGETPRRVGTRRSDHIVGLQVAASNIGAVALVGLAGLLVELAGLEAIGPAIFVNALLFAAFNELVTRYSRSRSRG
jgi:fucose permease